MLWACYWRQRRSGFAADRVLGNSVGANELVARSGGALRTVEAGDWGCFGDPLPEHSTLSGVWPLRFGASV
jgi:hypothetical protein